MQPQQPPGPSPPRLIRLCHNHSRLLAHPIASDPASPSLPPIALPRLPLSLIWWCNGLLLRFWQKQQRCIAVALMLDLSLRRWLPILPTQSCSARIVQWNPSDPYLSALPPQLVLAGSFQSAPPGDLLDAADQVPAFDGLHIVQQRRTSKRGRRTWLFLHSDHQTTLADPAELVSDDLDTALREAQDRLNLQ